VSYADMITLLMALFVILFSLGRLDLAKLEKFSQGFNQGLGDTFGVLSGGGRGGLGQAAAGAGPGVLSGTPDPNKSGTIGAVPDDELAQAAAAAERRVLSTVEQKIKKDLTQQGLERSVSFKFEARGLVISVLTDQVLFDLGKAVLRPDGQGVLDGLARSLGTIPNQLVVEGHTDNRPIKSGPFPTNWELSTARATTVLRYLIEHHGIPADRLSAAGYADTRPVFPNDSNEHKDRNRRVEVIVVNAQPSPSAPV
jgi:chemotaxis protein MotB